MKPGRRRALHYGIAALGVAGVVAAAAAVWWLAPGPDLQRWRSGPPPPTWAAMQRQEEVWRSEGIARQPRHSYVPLAQVAGELAVAVLIAEDVSFFDHGVVDLRAIGEAVAAWRRGARLRGASTISQQLAKILFLSPERTVRRKLEELRLAWWLERKLGKRRVLELYLNVVEFGPGLFGAEAAARHYFGQPAAALGAPEAAALAAAIPSPGRDNPDTATQRWRQRRDLIGQRSARAAWLHRRVAELQRPGPGALVNPGGPD